MGKKLPELLETLKRLNYWIRHSCEQSESEIQEFNNMLDQVYRTGWFSEMAIFGPVVQHCRPPAGDVWGLGSLVQAVLRVPGGIGAAFWDPEDFGRHQDADDFELELGNNFTIYDKCDPATRALILPTVEGLLEKFQAKL